jgi:hypothetical protein
MEPNTIQQNEAGQTTAGTSQAKSTARKQKQERNYEE